MLPYVNFLVAQGMQNFTEVLLEVVQKIQEPDRFIFETTPFPFDANENYGYWLIYMKKIFTSLTQVSLSLLFNTFLFFF